MGKGERGRKEGREWKVKRRRARGRGREGDRGGDWGEGRGFEVEFEWGFYALSASKAIFRARTYKYITYSVR